MNHIGDITKVNGSVIEPVDCIIGGSPCQGLSLAGKGKGLQDERSGLFMEQIRIIKEMRDATANIFPRFMVWENVPGAFSTNKGEDFQAVLEETVRIVEKDAVIPKPPKGRWRTSGCIVGDGWSIAWRVLDAQFWGVPQRRRRIALIADFGGQSAPEILFIRKSLLGDIEESREPRKRTSGDSEDYTGDTISFTNRGHSVSGGISETLRSECGRDVPCICIQGNCIDRADTAGCNGKGYTYDVSYTLNTIDRHAVLDTQNPIICLNDQGGICMEVTEDITGTLRSQMGGHPPLVLDDNCLNPYDPQRYRIITKDSICPTLDSASGGGAHGALLLDDVKEVYAIGNGQADSTGLHEKVATLDCMHDQQAVLIIENDDVAYSLDRATYNQSQNALFDISIQKELVQTLVAKGPHAVCVKKIVRRLTPLECERLQGFPDNWTDIGDWTDSKGKKKKSSDTARYKAIGNSIALPPWKWVLKRIAAQYERDATLGSLFDGIGGFPLIWEQLNGKGSCIWASEIDEFCVAVTEMRFK